MQRALVTHQEKDPRVPRRNVARFHLPHEETGREESEISRRSPGEQFLRGNRLNLLIDGQATFEAILAEIAGARICIFVQFYIVREDGLGLRLLEAPAARAADGIKVLFLLDRVGSAAMTPAVMDKWRGRGIKMATFCASGNWRDRWQLNFRNHRKNVIVDGRVGFVGGHNVGDEYLGKKPEVRSLA